MAFPLVLLFLAQAARRHRLTACLSWPLHMTLPCRSGCCGCSRYLPPTARVGLALRPSQKRNPLCHTLVDVDGKAFSSCIADTFSVARRADERRVLSG